MKKKLINEIPKNTRVLWNTMFCCFSVLPVDILAPTSRYFSNLFFPKNQELPRPAFSKYIPC